MKQMKTLTMWDGATFELFADDTPTDSKFFDIDYDGIVSLKPEYRGKPTKTTYEYSLSDNGVGVEGSKIDELPEKIVIPEVIDNTIVTGFQPGMFHYNFRVKEIVFPSTVSAIPESFARQAKYLRSIKNTENIESLGYCAFRQTRIDKAVFPCLKEVGKEAFNQSGLLYFADIGNSIESIPDGLFNCCRKLFNVRGGANVKSIGAQAFRNTSSLRKLPFLAQLKNIGNQAFQTSRIQYDWSSLTGCTFGTTQATPTQDNTVDFWTDATFEPCEHRLNSLINQWNPKWSGEQIGSSGKNYGDNGCVIISMLHIHSALTGEEFSDPRDFVSRFSAATQKVAPTAMANIKKYMAELWTSGGYGIEYEDFNDINSKDRYEQLCAAIKGGAYALVDSSATTANTGHAMVIYGINEIGEMLVLNSDSGSDMMEIYDDLFTMSMPFQNFTGPGSDIIIVKKPV